jgi:hypothetical protein
MAQPVSFGPETARRIIDQTRLAEARPRNDRVADEPRKALPRYYRVFELTEELSGGAGSTAAVKWLRWSTADEEYQDSGETGTITDTTGRHWGIAGEIGRAAWLGTDDAPIWEVVDTPGKPAYYGTLADDTTSSPCNVSITVAGSAQTVSCTLRETPDAGKKYASGTGCYVANTQDGWEIVSILSCTVDS